MILEVEQAVTRVLDVLGPGLVDCAVQVPADQYNEAIVTHVVPSHDDGDIVHVEGLLDINKLARALVDELGISEVLTP